MKKNFAFLLALMASSVALADYSYTDPDSGKTSTWYNPYGYMVNYKLNGNFSDSGWEILGYEFRSFYTGTGRPADEANPDAMTDAFFNTMAKQWVDDPRTKDWESILPQFSRKDSDFNIIEGKGSKLLDPGSFNDPKTSYGVVLMAYAFDRANGDYYVYMSEGNSFPAGQNPDLILNYDDTNRGMAEYAKGNAGWYWVHSVPEPSSALMLLLGFAGLALRRKKA